MLLELQRLDRTVLQLRRKGEQLPERVELAALEAEREAAKSSYMQAQRELDTRQLELGRIESDVELIRQREARDHQLMSVSTSSKEAVALQAELDTLSRRKSELEERQLEAMEVVESAEASFAQAEQVLAHIDERRSVILSRIEGAELEIAQELATTETERSHLADEIQGDLLALYERTRAQIGIGAARLRGNISEASNMALTPAEMVELNAAAPDDVIFCPGTGAILVRVDEE